MNHKCYDEINYFVPTACFQIYSGKMTLYQVKQIQTSFQQVISISLSKIDRISFKCLVGIYKNILYKYNRSVLNNVFIIIYVVNETIKLKLYNYRIEANGNFI